MVENPVEDPVEDPDGDPDGSGPTDDRGVVRQRLLSALEQADLDVDDLGDHRYMTMLSGEWKRTIPLLLEIGERHLHLTSLFCGVPDEGHEDVYRILLHRNERRGPVHFALDDEGDVILVGTVALSALDERGIDELLGAVLTTADETYNKVLRVGFSSYIDAEQRWRAKNELPPNPVGDAP